MTVVGAMHTIDPVPLGVYRSALQAAAQAIQDASRIVLASHINPDGDALGSMLALGLGLIGLNKAVVMVSADGVPAVYRFLPGSTSIVTGTDRRDFDLAIGLDAGDLSRVGSAEATLASASVLMDIDHHVTGGQFGTVMLLDSAAAATAEIVYDLLGALDVSITGEIATNLMTGLITDTGSFRYRSVMPRTMVIAADLIARGAVPDTICDQVFDNRPFGAQLIRGRALSRMQRSADGRIAWTHVSQCDFVETGASDELTEGIINEVRAIRGVDVALFLREMPSGRFRVSLRCNEPFDVSVIAAKFGGGGHRLAAGCSIDGPLAAAELQLVNAVQPYLTAGPVAGIVVGAC